MRRLLQYNVKASPAAATKARRITAVTADHPNPLGNTCPATSRGSCGHSSLAVGTIIGSGSTFRHVATSSGGTGGDGQPRPPTIKIRMETPADIDPATATPPSANNESAASNPPHPDGSTTTTASDKPTTSSSETASNDNGEHANHTASAEEGQVSGATIDRLMTAQFPRGYRAVFEKYIIAVDTNATDDMKSLEAQLMHMDVHAKHKLRKQIVERWWWLGLVFGGGYVYYRAYTTPTHQYGPLTLVGPDGDSRYFKRSHAPKTDDERKAHEQSVKAQEAFIRFTGLWSIVAGVSVLVSSYPLLELALIADYSYLMWQRYGSRWLSNATAPSAPVMLTGGADSTTQLKHDSAAPSPQPDRVPAASIGPQTHHHNLHEEILSKAFPVWFMSTVVVSIAVYSLKTQLILLIRASSQMKSKAAAAAGSMH